MTAVRTPSRNLRLPPASRYLQRGATIAIASPGPTEPELSHSRYGELRSRSGALLRHTTSDAETIHHAWKKLHLELPDELHTLLIDPAVNELESTIATVSKRLQKAYPEDIGIDLYFAGHGEPLTGNLMLKDGSLSPSRFLNLQEADVSSKRSSRRRVGVMLDSCYSGAFLLRLAIAALEDFDGWFFFESGLASSLQDEPSYEMEALGHGVFTFTRLYQGNKHVDHARFNQAILQNDVPEIARAVQGLVGMTSSATAFLTEGKQFPLHFEKHYINVEGGYAQAELQETNDIAELTEQLVAFKSDRAQSRRS